MTNHADFSVRAYVPYHFALLSSRMSKALSRTCETKGLTLLEWRLLAIIASSGRVSAVDVVAQSTMDKVAVHRGVKALLEKRLVSRGDDLDDRRIKHLALTAAGRRKYLSVVPAALELERRMFESLTDAEARALERAMHKLAEVQF